MSTKDAKGPQLKAIPSEGFLDQISFNAEKSDQLVTGRSVELIHYKCMPSPIGIKEVGDNRRTNDLDSISSNGMLYSKAGCFSGAILGNGKQKKSFEANLIDASTAHLVLPRFYNKNDLADGDRIYLSPGDRIYIKECNVEVANAQKCQYRPGKVDFLQFPALHVERLVDSNNVEYSFGYHFVLDNDGHISWVTGKPNPGIDPDTGEGRVYSVRYLYNAHWYVSALINEVRMVSITNDAGQRVPTRMPYSAMIQREYVYYNIPKSGVSDPKPDDPMRPSRRGRDVDPDTTQPDIRVNMGRFSE